MDIKKDKMEEEATKTKPICISERKIEGNNSINMAPTKTMVASLLAVVFVATTAMVAAEDFEVGGADGWRLQPTDDTFYTEWAKKQKFKVGDTLVFTFSKGMHDVTEVSEEAYESCDISNPVSPAVTTPPANIKLDSDDDKYFVCGVNNHCKSGMKMAVKVGGKDDDDASESPSPSSSSSSGSSPSSAPSGSTASATAPSGSPSSAAPVATLFVVFFSLALLFVPV